MLLSPSATRALKALIYLAGQDRDVPVLVRDIAAAESLPHPFLSKLLHTMRNTGVVRSKKGPGGGYSLARAPEDLQLQEIVDSFDPNPDQEDACILGLGCCSSLAGCALHDLRKQLLDTVGSMTLSQLAEMYAAKSPQARRDCGPGRRITATPARERAIRKR